MWFLAEFYPIYLKNEETEPNKEGNIVSEMYFLCRRKHLLDKY